jgi:hypothetical protein
MSRNIPYYDEEEPDEDQPERNPDPLDDGDRAYDAMIDRQLNGGGRIMSDILIWCRNTKCVQFDALDSNPTDKDGPYGMCSLKEITINRDSKCEDREDVE